jgi:hypothetical protein
MSAILIVDDSLTVRMDLIEALDAARRCAATRSRSRSWTSGFRTATASSSSPSSAPTCDTPTCRS